jgi:hypothetical protein
MPVGSAHSISLAMRTRVVFEHFVDVANRLESG